MKLSNLFLILLINTAAGLPVIAPTPTSLEAPTNTLEHLTPRATSLHYSSSQAASGGHSGAKRRHVEKRCSSWIPFACEISDLGGILGAL